MKRISGVLAVIFTAMLADSTVTLAQDVALPSPMTLADVVRIATERRDEIQGARARVRASEARPTIVAALDDPMFAPSLDHLPFTMVGADVSFIFEQQFPLSGVRQHRRAVALAEVERVRAEADRTVLDVGVDAITAYLMLQERRRTAALVTEQLTFARDVVNAADARYSAATAPQSDVLRAEVEVSRLDAIGRALVSELRGAEAMLNTSLARDPWLPVPELAPLGLVEPVPSSPAIEAALTTRPELAAARAGIARAGAEVQVMRDMFRPMLTVRTGPAYTMAEGRGWMAMVGISLPIWRDKLRAGVAEATAMREMSEAELRAITRMLGGEAAAAAYRLQAARDRQQALSAEVLPRAQLAIQPAVSSYGAGQLPLVSVIESVQALWIVRLDLIAAETEVGI